MTQCLKVVRCYIITSYLAGDYFQTLHNIIAPAAPMVQQQSCKISLFPKKVECSFNVQTNQFHITSVGYVTLKNVLVIVTSYFSQIVIE